MRKDDLELMCCPACGGGLSFTENAPLESLPGFDPARMAWEGRFTCSDCGANYPMIDGVACLGRLDESWLMPLREAESRICLTMRTLEEEVWEAGRGEQFVKQGQQAKGIAEIMSDAAMDFIDFSTAPRILDLGAGDCPTTELFAARGARPIALDVDLPQLLHLSFKDVDTLPPESWQSPKSGRVFHRKSPEALERYFTRTFANIGRLPFHDGAFDVVFCRAVLHHLTDHATTMREMARVVKPGGMMIFCAEPVRSIFEDEENLYDHCVDREEGMNERVWPLSHFTDPIKSLGEDWMIHTWPMPPSTSLQRKLPLLANFLTRRIGFGAQVRGWQRLLLPFVNASVTIFARRSDAAAPPAPVRPQPQGLSPEVLVQEFAALAEGFRVLPGEVGKGVEQLEEKRQAVARLRRRLLTACGQALPAAIDPGNVPVYELDRGWLDACELKGRVAREMAREAWVTLALPTSGAQDQRLVCDVQSNQPARWSVWVNGMELERHDGTAQAWQRLQFSLPPIDEPLLSVRLRCEAKDSAQSEPLRRFVARISIES